jgi:SP family general alpha glucoside:H+ symporter-like MFS transporter
MSSGDVERKHDASEVEKHDASEADTHDLQKKDILHSEVLVNQDLLTAAYDGENREHDMGPWEAVKLHPMACFWAFIFCFTIVGLNLFDQ